MAGAFTAVDLSQLPFPDAVEPLDFETILAQATADLIAREPDFSALVESDPVIKALEVFSYREVLVRQRANESVKAVSLAYAQKNDLTNIAAGYDVQRLLLDAGDPDAIPPVAPTYEDDESLRRRTQLSFEGFSTAGPEGAYIFHSLGADADVLDVAVDSPRFSKIDPDDALAALLPPGAIVLQCDYSAGLVDPMPGMVAVSILSRVGDGTASPDLRAAVATTLSDTSVRPLTDDVQVLAGGIINYSVTAQLILLEGPDSSVVLAESQASMQAYADATHRLGRNVTLSGIYAALHVPGVQKVILTSPSADVVTAVNEAPYCTGITLTYGGTDA